VSLTMVRWQPENAPCAGVRSCGKVRVLTS
jgi:hypothetical protein